MVISSSKIESICMQVEISLKVESWRAEQQCQASECHKRRLLGDIRLELLCQVSQNQYQQLPQRLQLFAAAVFHLRD